MTRTWIFSAFAVILIFIIVFLEKYLPVFYEECPDTSQYPEEQPTEVDRETEIKFRNSQMKFPHNLLPGMEYKRPFKINRTGDDALAENSFTSYMETIRVECRERARIGDIRDGGWDICLVGQYKPQPGCLIYSFGVGPDWTFDDSVATEFGCTVRTFDPTIGLEEHNRSDNIHFYPIGLGGQDGDVKIFDRGSPDERGIVLHTLKSIMELVGDEHRVIDYLKMDIDKTEWQALPNMLNDGILKRVKQFGFEVHTFRNETAEEFADYLDLFMRLESEGFMKWYSHMNPLSFYESRKSGRLRARCHELVYINLHYLDTNYTP